MSVAKPSEMMAIAETAVTQYEAWQRTVELAWLLRRVAGAEHVIEVGRMKGGTLWALTQVCHPSARIVSIDNHDYTQSEMVWFESLGREDQRVELIHDDSEVALKALAYRRTRYDVILIDGDHFRCFDDYHAAVPLLDIGGIIGLHDIHGTPDARCGRVPELWSALRRRHRTTAYISDRSETWGGWGVVWAS